MLCGKSVCPRLFRNGGDCQSSCWIGEAKFVGLTKKAVRDRVLLLLDQHGKADAKKRKGSGTDEEYGELERLLTELRDLQLEKDKAKQPAAQAAQADRARAEALREEACSTLASKSLLASKSAEPPAKRAKLSATEVVTACIREKNESEAEAEKRRMTLEERKVAIQEKQLEQAQSGEHLKLESAKLELQKAELEAKVTQEKAERESRDKRDDMFMAIMNRVIEKL